jgi:Ser/Thr protein kinase RdoA (MazF antagonist)
MQSSEESSCGGWERLNSTQLTVFRQVADRFKAAASDLGAGDGVFGLIHGDFTFDNLLFFRRDVRVIDFDDCGFGYFLYDLATLLDRIE